MRRIHVLLAALVLVAALWGIAQTQTGPIAGVTTITVSSVTGTVQANIDQIAGEALTGNPVRPYADPITGTDPGVLSLGLNVSTSNFTAEALPMANHLGEEFDTSFVPVGGYDADNDNMVRLDMDAVGRPNVNLEVIAGDTVTGSPIVDSSSATSNVHYMQIGGTGDDATEKRLLSLFRDNDNMTSSSAAAFPLAVWDESETDANFLQGTPDGDVNVNGNGRYSASIACGEQITIANGLRTFALATELSAFCTGACDSILLQNRSSTFKVKVLEAEVAGGPGHMLHETTGGLADVLDTTKKFYNSSNLWISTTAGDCAVEEANDCGGPAILEVTCFDDD